MHVYVVYSDSISFRFFSIVECNRNAKMKWTQYWMVGAWMRISWGAELLDFSLMLSRRGRSFVGMVHSFVFASMKYPDYQEYGSLKSTILYFIQIVGSTNFAESPIHTKRPVRPIGNYHNESIHYTQFAVTLS